MRLYPGSEVQITCTVKDADGVLATPSALQITLRDPADADVVTTIGSLELVSPGVYRHTVVLALAGRYYFRWDATGGAVVGVNEGWIKVNETLLPTS